MEREEYIACVGRRALELFRRKEVGLSNRLERHGLLSSVVVEIAVCVDEAMWEFCKASPGIGPQLTMALLETELFGKARTTEETEGAKESDRARDAILSGGGDPATPAPTSGPSNFAHSYAATRARIAEGIAGL